MLKKINRSLTAKNFAASRNNSRLFQNPLFGLAVVTKDDGVNQFGFVISKKISKKAVVRNKIRRVMSDAVKNNLALLKTKANFIFLVKTSILSAKSELIENEIRNVLQKIG